MGEPVEIVLTPNPLEFDAMLRVLEASKFPPPVSPGPAIIAVVSAAAPSCVLAIAAVLPPVPPEDTGSGLIPEMLPPVMLTALALCTDIEPNPRLSLAEDGLLPPVPPESMGRAVIPEIVPPVMATALAS